MEFLILDHCDKGFDAGGVGHGGETGASSKIKWGGGGWPIGVEVGVGTGIGPWSSALHSSLSKLFGLPETLAIPYLPSNIEIAGERCWHRQSCRI
jgi:hypothetical protein